MLPYLGTFAELFLIIYAIAFILPVLTTTQLPDVYVDQVSVEVALDALAQQNWEWSWASLIPCVVLWTAWQYSRRFRNPLLWQGVRTLVTAGAASRSRTAAADDSKRPEQEQEQATATSQQNDPAPAAEPTPESIVEATRSMQLATAEEKIKKKDKELLEKNALLEECWRQIALRDDELTATAERMCWPSVVNKIVCVTSHPSHDSEPAEVHDPEWRFGRLREILRNANMPFKAIMTWNRAEGAASSTAMPRLPESDEATRLSLLEPAAHNVARFSRNSLVTANGVPGSGKSTTLTRIASHLGKLMLAQYETKALRVFFTYFSLSGEELDVLSLSEAEMDRWKARVATRKPSIRDRLEQVLVVQPEKPYWVVHDQTALDAALQHARSRQAVQPDPLNPYSQDSHLLIELSRIEGQGLDEETVANGALMILDVQGGSTPSQPAANPGPQAVYQWLANRMVNDSKLKTRPQLIQSVNRINYSFTALITHVNVNHPTAYNEHTLSTSGSVP